MFKRIPVYVVWSLVALAVALVPLACGSSGDSTDGPHDTQGDMSPTG